MKTKIKTINDGQKTPESEIEEMNFQKKC